MYYLRLGVCLVLVLMAGCSPKIVSHYRHYESYYLRESYFNDRNGGEGGVQIYLVDSMYVKGKRIYFADYVYSFDKNKPAIRKKQKEKKGNKTYIFCNCPDLYRPFTSIDTLMILRFIEISDSLNWGKATYLKNLDGFKPAK